MADNENRVDCFKCAHFAVTWEPAKPRACRFFGFKTAGMPSVEVKRSSGEDCQGFLKKNTENKVRY